MTALYRFYWHLKRQKKKRKDWRIPNPNTKPHFNCFPLSSVSLLLQLPTTHSLSLSLPKLSDPTKKIKRSVFKEEQQHRTWEDLQLLLVSVSSLAPAVTMPPNLRRFDFFSLISNLRSVYLKLLCFRQNLVVFFWRYLGLSFVYFWLINCLIIH